jgi:hypothetical protein
MGARVVRRLSGVIDFEKSIRPQKNANGTEDFNLKRAFGRK